MAHPDFQEFIKGQQPAKVVLLYHWDVDGLVSCAQFKDYIEKESPNTQILLEHPTINRYFLVEEEFQRIAEYQADAVVMMDFNAPLDTVEQLEKNNIVYVFDNHSQTADIDRPGFQDIHYPSASMLINDYFMTPLSLASVLGAVGDKEEEIMDDLKFWPMIEQVMKDHNLDWDTMQRITKLGDTMYMLGDSSGMEDTIELFRRDPRDILTHERYLQNEKYIAIEMARVLNQDPKRYAETDDLVAFGFESDVSVLSEATRAKAREFADKVVFTWQSKGGLDMIYVRTRSKKIDCRDVTEFARSLGQNSGGKPEVAGIVLLTETMEEFLPKVEAYLIEQLSK